MPQLFTNFAATTLSAPVGPSDLTGTVADGSGLPSPAGDDFFMLVLATAVTEASREIVKVTGRSGNTLTWVRAQEGTSAQSWASGDKAELRETASILNSLAGMFVTVNSPSHGRTTGQAVYFDGAAWQLAKSDSESTLGIGIVVVIDANNYKVYTTGQIVGLSGLTAGQYYFVSDATAGLLTATEPTATTSFSNPLLFAITTTSGIVLPFRPSQVLTSVSYVTLIDFLLDNEPIAYDATYTATRTGSLVTKESWFYTGPALTKSIDYTYANGFVSTEVRKVFAANGVTILGQTTVTYTYANGYVASATYVRNI